ncbi:hypothetical protein LJK88_36765 [Paenibacillus sp. P26]|nr:hypothetical protein LJK88_36765 [Paenibacillus sp. P26]
MKKNIAVILSLAMAFSMGAGGAATSESGASKDTSSFKDLSDLEARPKPNMTR